MLASVNDDRIVGNQRFVGRSTFTNPVTLTTANVTSLYKRTVAVIVDDRFFVVMGHKFLNVAYSEANIAIACSADFSSAPAAVLRELTIFSCHHHPDTLVNPYPATPTSYIADRSPPSAGA